MVSKKLSSRQQRAMESIVKGEDNGYIVTSSQFYKHTINGLEGRGLIKLVRREPKYIPGLYGPTKATYLVKPTDAGRAALAQNAAAKTNAGSLLSESEG